MVSQYREKAFSHEAHGVFLFGNKKRGKAVTFSCLCADCSGDLVKSGDKRQLQNDDASSRVTDPKCGGASQRTMVLLLEGWLCLCLLLVKQTYG